jgi:hypothetical protein
LVLAGETERALDLLEEHFRASTVQADWLLHDIDWEAVRDHP